MLLPMNVDSGRSTTFRSSTAIALILVAFCAISIETQEINPQFRKPVDCTKLRDGNYVYGCSRFWSMCSNNIESPMQCAQGLVLNPENDQCNKPKAVSVCSKSALAGGQKLYRSKDPFTCKGRADGNYEAEPCSGFYFQCHYEHRNEMPCPAGLVFNVVNSACDYAENCEKARKSSPPTSGFEVVGKDGNIPEEDAGTPAKRPPGPPRRSRMGSWTPENNNEDAGPPAIAPPSDIQHVKPVAGEPLEDTFIVSQAPVKPQTYLSTAPKVPNIYAANTPEKKNEPTAPPPPFNCIGRRDAVYLWKSNACTRTFWKCSNGQPFKYDCPPGLFYNIQNGQCDYKDFVVSCGGKPAPPTTTPAYDIIQAAAEVKKVDVRCAGKKDGLYTDKACTKDFYSCTAGLTHSLTCQTGLVYDIVSNNCEFPTDCGKAHPTLPPQSPLDQALYHGGADYYFNPQASATLPPLSTPPRVAYLESAAPTTPYVSAPNFNCKGRSDGYYYKQKCTSSFVICSGGQVSEQKCPGSLVFDPLRIACQYSDECGKPIPPTTPAPPTQNDYSYGVKQVQAVPDVACAGRSNVYLIKEPCTSTFYTCVDGQTIRLSCPPTLVFDVNAKRCDYPSRCGKNIEPVANSAPAYASAGYAVISQPQQEQPRPSFDCKNKKDGYYAKQNCQPKFLTCAAGSAIEINCPGNLVFDLAKSACDWPGNCGKPAQTTTITSTSYNYQPQQQQQEPAGINYNIPAQPQQPIVQQQEQTQPIYTPQSAIQQQQPFYNPVPSAPIQQIVPQTYHRQRQSTYDNAAAVEQPVSFVQQSQPQAVYAQPQQQQQPVYAPNPIPQEQAPAYIPAPPQQQPVDPVYNPIPEQQQQPPVGYAQNVPAQQYAQQVQTAGSQFNCADRKDGYYIKKDCTSSFFVCTGGIASKQGCPGKLVFDIATSTCEYEEHSPLVSYGPAKDPQQQQNYVQQPKKSNYNCKNQRDGSFSVGPKCVGNAYVICSNGITYDSHCPSGLVFDQTQQICTFVENCGVPVKPTVQQQNPSPYQRQSVSPKAQQPIPQSYNDQYNQAPAVASSPRAVKVLPIKFTIPQSNSQQTRPLKTTCGNLTQGTKKISDCSQHYISCWDGQVYEGECYQDLYYNPINGFCDYKENVVGCQQGPASPSRNGYAQPQQQQQPDPVQNYNNVASSPVAQSNYNTQSAYQPKPADATKKIECRGEKNGFYAQGCKSHFFHCADGQSIVLHCPGGLFYDLITGACNYKEFVEACGGKRVQNNPVPQSIKVVAKTQSSYTTVAPPTIKCSQHDGYFAEGCSNTYYACLSGIGYAFACPHTNLRYSQKSGQCDYIERVPECGGKVPQIQSSQPINTYAPIQSQPPSAYPSIQAQPAPPSAINPYNRQKQPEAPINENNYAAQSPPAEPIIAYAPEVAAAPIKAPENDYRPPSAPAPVDNVYPKNAPVAPVNVYATNIQQSAPVPQTPAPPTFDCTKHKDGYIADGCSSTYYYCNGGKTTPMKCPGNNLKYSKKDAQCEEKEFVPECGGKSRPENKIIPDKAYTVPAKEAPIVSPKKTDDVKASDATNYSR